MTPYLELLRTALEEGKRRPNRTGIDTLGIFGYQLRCPLAEGFPLLTTKRLHWRSIVYELLWFLRGDTNVKYLHNHGVTIWDEWADANGDLGPIYGRQWRAWPTPDGGVVDQLSELCETLRRDPTSRRMIVSAWNPGVIKEMALPPCHALFQLYVEDGKLSLLLYQRSADLFLGVPFNIASYALLVHLLAHSTGLQVGDFVHTLGDAHLYVNHLEQAREQLTRTPRALPTLSITGPQKAVWEYDFDDITLTGYDPWPRISAPVAV